MPGGRRLLGLVQGMMQTGLAMARHMKRIVREHLAGQDLAQLTPAGFDAFQTDARIAKAVAWTAALRERLRAGLLPPAFAPAMPKERLGEDEAMAVRTPRGRGVMRTIEVEVRPEWTEGVMRAWIELARPWRLGPAAVAFEARKIADLSDRDVVAAICENLQQAAEAFGAEADIARITALEEAARALCPEADEGATPADESAEGGGDSGGAGDAQAAWMSDVSGLAGTVPEGGQDPPPPVGELRKP